jgi:hypothetical protein
MFGYNKSLFLSPTYMNNNNYNKNIKVKDEKEYDSDGFEIVSSIKKPKQTKIGLNDPNPSD